MTEHENLPGEIGTSSFGTPGERAAHTAGYRAGVESVKKAVLDIDAHAVALGEDEHGFVTGGYLISVGCLHRALGIVGHPAPPCPTCTAESHDCGSESGGSAGERGKEQPRWLTHPSMGCWTTSRPSSPSRRRAGKGSGPVAASAAPTESPVLLDLPAQMQPTLEVRHDRRDRCCRARVPDRAAHQADRRSVMSASKRVRFGKARCVRCGGQLYVPGDAPSTIQCGTCSFTAHRLPRGRHR